ncbi:torsin-1A [Halyomorpha halys]|uniref:torsin-1A n=1 Tax=Halyomorpha halys TaxID=286706 RepID=UPI0006D4CF64|nr:torsin-1A [Halyomorpha halys]
MSYFKKTIKIIIIVLYLEFTYSQTILDSIRNIGLNLDNLVFCNEFWLPTNKFSGLKEKLKSDVFGQPFVKNNLIPILEDYYIKPNYKDGRNALVLSFHGPSGVGKSFVSEILSFAPFIKNKHLFSAKNIFFDRSLIDKHKANINQLIDSSVRDCEKSLFVFDDADYFPSGFFEKLNVFRNIDGDLKYGGSMFIFIFQVGAEQLSTLTLDLLNKGEKREAFHVQDFRDIIKDAMLDKGYSKDSIFMKPLNKIIPFLPLEKEHVKKCIDKGLVSDGYDITENDYKKVYEQLNFQSGTSFSSSGCKLALVKLSMDLKKKIEL